MKNRNNDKKALSNLQDKSPFQSHLPKLRDFKIKFHRTESNLKNKILYTNYRISDNINENIQSFNRAYFSQLSENKLQYEMKVQKRKEEEKNKQRLFCLTDTDYFRKENKRRPQSNNLKDKTPHLEPLYSSFYIRNVKGLLDRRQGYNTMKIHLTPIQNNSEKKILRMKSKKIVISPTKIGLARCIKKCVRDMKTLKLNYDDVILNKVLRFSIFSKTPFDKPKSKIFMQYVKENDILGAKHLLEYDKFFSYF